MGAAPIGALKRNKCSGHDAERTCCKNPDSFVTAAIRASNFATRGAMVAPAPAAADPAAVVDDAAG
jgi:hypothetical protein